MFGWRVVLWGAVAMLLVGCFRRAALDDSPSKGAPSSSSGGSSSSSSSGGTTDDDSTSSSTSSGGTTTTSTGGTTGGTTSTSSDTGGGAFIEEPDYGVHVPCHVTEQDCPEGEKCVPWCDDGGTSINAVKCEPIPEDPKVPWEPCVSEGGQCSGVDDCDIGSVCWSWETWEGPGICHPLCLEQGECPSPDGYCPISAEPWLCLLKCDPLLQDCANGEACVEGGQGFTCRPHDDTAGDDGAECNWGFECLPGFACWGSPDLPDCESPQCCTPVCDPSIPEVCPAAAQGEVCVASFPDFGFDYVGVCRLP